MLAMVGAGKRVLEFGCASGYMSARMKAAGCHVTGVEIDATAVAEAREVCDELIVADLDMQPLADVVPARAYDVVVFGDVLEHLRDPWRVLDESRKFLGPGGYAVVSIPNIAHGSVRLKLLQGDFDYAELGILDDTHLRFFTLKSIEELCLRAGYRIDTIERTKVPLFQETTLTPSSREMLFDPELIEQIRRDPEHDTLQFVFRAYPLGDDEKFEVLARELAGLRDRLRVAETAARLSQEAYDEVEAELERRERAARPPAGDLTVAQLAVPDDGEALHLSGRSRGKTISARAIKRAEALAKANEHLIAANDALVATKDNLVVELEEARSVVEELTADADAGERERRALRDRLADLKAAHARCADVEADHKRYREAVALSLRRFVRYAESEIESVNARIAEMDGAIRAVQDSKLWSLKSLLGKFRR
jgi:SAM-dependent methyltransferase